MLRVVVVLTGLALATGCIGPHTVEDSGIVIDGLQFNNPTPDTLTDIQLQVIATGELVGCSHIPPGGQCSTRFPLRRYRGNEVEISWFHHKRRLSTGRLVIVVPPEPPAGVPLTVKVNIDSGGQAQAVLAQ